MMCQVVDGTGQHVPERIQRVAPGVVPVGVDAVAFRIPDGQVSVFFIQVLAQVSGKTEVIGLE